MLPIFLAQERQLGTVAPSKKLPCSSHITFFELYLWLEPTGIHEQRIETTFTRITCAVSPPSVPAFPTSLFSAAALATVRHQYVPLAGPTDLRAPHRKPSGSTAAYLFSEW